MEDTRQAIVSEDGAAGSAPQPSPPVAPRSGDRLGPLAACVEKALSAEFRSALAEVLQVPLEVRFRGVQECAWGDFLGSVEERSCCLVLAAGGGVGKPGTDPDSRGGNRGGSPVFPQAWLEISPQIAFPIIDRLLGGTAREWYVPSRALTTIEQRLLHRVGELAARCLSGAGGAEDGAAAAAGEGPPAGAAGRAASWECLGCASDLPEAAQEGPACLAKFTLSMGRQAGALRLCLPMALVEPFLSPSGEAGGPQGRLAAASGAGPQAAPSPGGPLELSVVVQDIAVTEEELSRLAEGDLLVTDTPADGEVIVRIGGIPRYYARLGASNGRKAIRITRRIDP